MSVDGIGRMHPSTMKFLALLAMIVTGCSPAAKDEGPAQNSQAAQTPAPVQAGSDVVAVYRMDDPAGNRIGTLTVEADESGAARIETRNSGPLGPAQVGWATQDGDVIMMGSTPEGPKLMRASDLAAASAEMIKSVPGGRAQDMFAGFRLLTLGSEAVNGRTGTRYAVSSGSGPAEAADFGIDVVIAEDPALAPIGRATSHTLGPSTSALGHLTPPAFLELQQRMRAGAALRIGRFMILESVENKPIDPARLVVQGTPIPREELLAIFRRALPSSSPTAPAPGRRNE